MGMLKDYSHMQGRNNPKWKTGLAKAGKRIGFYNTWQNMKARCLNQSHPKFHRYGGRGVKICDEWMTIEGFSKWATSSGWQPGLTIDRIDNDGDYCPENCQWITPQKNSKKKSTTVLSPEDVSEIRRRSKNGESDIKIASDFGVCPATVWWVKHNKTHKEIP